MNGWVRVVSGGDQVEDGRGSVGYRMMAQIGYSSVVRENQRGRSTLRFKSKAGKCGDRVWR